MKELRISVRVKKTIQESKFEPFTLEIELEDAITVASERESAVNKLHRQAEALLENGINERTGRPPF